MMAKLLELAERCEKAPAGGHPLDLEIAIAVGWQCKVTYHDEGEHEEDWIDPKGEPHSWYPFFTRSIDSAIGLVPEGHNWLVRSDGDGAFANVSRPDATALVTPIPAGVQPEPEVAYASSYKQGHRHARAATPGLALAASALRARAAIRAGEPA